MAENKPHIWGLLCGSEKRFFPEKEIDLEKLNTNSIPQENSWLFELVRKLPGTDPDGTWAKGIELTKITIHTGHIIILKYTHPDAPTVNWELEIRPLFEPVWAKNDGFETTFYTKKMVLAVGTKLLEVPVGRPTEAIALTERTLPQPHHPHWPAKDNFFVPKNITPEQLEKTANWLWTLADQP